MFIISTFVTPNFYAIIELNATGLPATPKGTGILNFCSASGLTSCIQNCPNYGVVNPGISLYFGTMTGAENPPKIFSNALFERKKKFKFKLIYGLSDISISLAFQ